MVDRLDSDRRQLQRFSLRAPAIVRAAVQDRESVVELYTRDICSGGAFLQTADPLPVGIYVDITLFLMISAVRNLQGQPGKVKITTVGTVVRSEEAGMAVAFDSEYQMVPVPS